MEEIDSNWHSETIAVHAGRSADPTTGAVAAPIHLSTTFQRAEDGSFPTGFNYSRSDNPNRAALEKALAIVEGGEVAAAFASGVAAAMAIFQALSPNDHVIAPIEAYHGILRLLRDVFTRWHLEVDCVDMINLEAVQKAVRSQTKLIWIETPSNPTLKLTDIAAVAQTAHAGGALLACDNTWSPLIQRPFDLGLIWSCIRPQNISAGTVTSWAARSSRGTRVIFFAGYARSKPSAAPSRRRSIAGWFIAGCRHCPGAFGRIPRTRSALRNSSNRIRKLHASIIPASLRIRSMRSRAGS